MIRRGNYVVASAFTLIELMLSLTLALLLMLGVSQVFRATGLAVGAGNALTEETRNARVASAQLLDDLNRVSPDGPAFFISSKLVANYLSQADFASNNYSISPPAGPLLDRPSGNRIVPPLLGSRVHRVDLLSFFATGQFTRRTADDGKIGDATTASDAFITIGHAAMPNIPAIEALPNNQPPPPQSFNGPQNLTFLPPSGNFSNPSGIAQQLGFFASDWVLAHSAILLKDPRAIPNNTSLALARQSAANEPPAFPNQNLTPLGYDSPVSSLTGGTPPAWKIEDSRTDLAAATLDNVRSYFAQAYWSDVFNATSNPVAPWWSPACVASASAPSYGSTPSQRVQPLSSSGPTVPDLARPRINTLFQRPLDAAAIARMSPYFLAHVSQFVVEYAGDYLQQDGGANLTGLGPDGTIDFYIDASGNRQIRWYGLPRQVGSIGTTSIIGVNPVAIVGGTSVPTSQYVDVIPLRDFVVLWLNHVQGAANTTASSQCSPSCMYGPLNQLCVPQNSVQTPSMQPLPAVEQDLTGLPMATGTSAASSSVLNATDYTLAGSSPKLLAPGKTPQYICAWANDVPAMVRILIKLDDPDGNLQDGPWFEYVFQLKR